MIEIVEISKKATDYNSLEEFYDKYKTAIAESYEQYIEHGHTCLRKEDWRDDLNYKPLWNLLRSSGPSWNFARRFGSLLSQEYMKTRCFRHPFLCLEQMYRIFCKLSEKIRQNIQ